MYNQRIIYNILKLLRLWGAAEHSESAPWRPSRGSDIYMTLLEHTGPGTKNCSDIFFLLPHSHRHVHSRYIKAGSGYSQAPQ